MEIYNLVSLVGIFVLAGFAWLCSSNKRVINWRVVFWGISLQLLFALFIFMVPVGTRFFLFVNKIVVVVLDSATAGAKFLFGRLALAPKRLKALSRLGFRALLAATLACLMTGAVAGLFFTKGSILFGK